MNQTTSEPSIIDFKTFINKHPRLLAHVRKNGHSWQTYYDKWSLLGESDSYWDKFKNKHDDDKNNLNIIKQLISLVEDIDIKKVEKHIKEMSGVIDTAQKTLTNMQKNKNVRNDNTGKNLFHYLRD